MATAVVLIALLAVCIYSQVGVWQLKKELRVRSLHLQQESAAVSAYNGKMTSLKYLQQLEQSAIPFYSIFGWISDQLPRGILLEGVQYENRHDGRFVKLDTVMRNSTPWKNEQIFTSLIKKMDQSESLDCTRQPDISVFKTSEEQFIKINLACQVELLSGRNEP
jgi:hypothetical protein